MKFLFHSILTTVTSLILLTQHGLSTPLPRPQHAQVHVDLGTIFQIPIQTLNAVGTLIKNVHTAKKNFLAPNGFGGGGAGGLSINVHVGQPMGDSSEMGNLFPNNRPIYPSKKPASNKPASGYPTKKPLGFPTKPPTSYPSSEATPATGFPDYQPPGFSPVFPESSSVRPVSGVVTPELTFPQQPQVPVEEEVYPSGSPSLAPTDGPTSGVYSPDVTFPDLTPVSSSAAPPSYNPTTRFAPALPSSRQPSYDRVPPAPAVQTPYRPSAPPKGSSSGGVQPLSLDVGGGVNALEKETTKEKNFKDYVAKKLAERNFQDNRISHTF